MLSSSYFPLTTDMLRSMLFEKSLSAIINPRTSFWLDVKGLLCQLVLDYFCLFGSCFDFKYSEYRVMWLLTVLKLFPVFRTWLEAKFTFVIHLLVADRDWVCSFDFMIYLFICGMVVEIYVRLNVVFGIWRRLRDPLIFFYHIINNKR